MIRRPPRSTRTDTRFPYTTLFRSEILLRTGRIASNTARDSRLEKAVMGELGMQCFMCGRALTRRGNAGVDKYTVEHLWPISFGGETIEGNLRQIGRASCRERDGQSV